MKAQRPTKPRYDSAGKAAIWLNDAVVNGTAVRGNIALCRDGRMYIGLSSRKFFATDRVENGQRVLKGQGVTALISEDVYQGLLAVQR